jgi:dienelactone hydrolase
MMSVDPANRVCLIGPVTPLPEPDSLPARQRATGIKKARWAGALLPSVLICLAFFGPSRASGAEDNAPAAPKAQILTTPGGVRYGIWPAKPSAPAPTVFIFAASIEDTLNDTYFRQAGNLLATKGYLCVSVDLPCHGQEVRPHEPMGLNGWRARCDAGENFVEDGVQHFSAVLDELIATKLADPEKVAACGTSRGGFMAMHFAARDPRIGCVAAFAPTTDLTVLKEFQGMEKRDLVDRVSLQSNVKRLAGRPLWIITGDRDQRVGTDLTIAFARRVTAESLEAKLPALVDLLVLSEPRGHAIPAGVSDQAAEWIDRILRRPVAAK